MKKKLLEIADLFISCTVIGLGVFTSMIIVGQIIKWFN